MEVPYDLGMQGADRVGSADQTNDVVIGTRAPQAEGVPVVRRLSHEEARLEQLRYWAGKSIAERLAAGTELTERLYRMRGIDRNERKADFSVSRVRRGGR